MQEIGFVNMRQSAERAKRPSMPGRALMMAAVALALAAASGAPEAHAAGIVAENTSLRGTTIMTLTNGSDMDMETVRMWLMEGFEFASFKTESGWTGTITQQGVIVFTATEPVRPGESVKFGIKTVGSVDGINWRALDPDGAQISVSKSLTNEIDESPPQDTSDGAGDSEPPEIGDTILDYSAFRIVPAIPNPGADVRIVGENFKPDGTLYIYMDASQSGDPINTGQDGNFVATRQIPDDADGDLQITAASADGGERSVWIRVEQPRQDVEERFELTVDGIPSVAHRGTFLELSGTGTPDGHLTVDLLDPDGITKNSETAEIDPDGNWSMDGPLIVALDAEYGTYAIVLNDGNQSVRRDVAVESNKVIEISSTHSQYSPGNVMEYEIKVLPNQQASVILEGPRGKEIVWERLSPDHQGNISFNYKTSSGDEKGTYTLIVTQGTDNEFLHVGLGVRPERPVNIEFDRLNYQRDDVAVVTVTGEPSETVTLLVLDSTGNQMDDAIEVGLREDGLGAHLLEMQYATGVYTAVVNKGTLQSEETFTVGLQVGSGKISINTTRENNKYMADEPIVILGSADPERQVTISLIDPDGNTARVKESYSDATGKISESAMRIPSNAEHGVWSIKAKTGDNFDQIDIRVADPTEGLIITVNDEQMIRGHLSIIIDGAHPEAKIRLEIMHQDGELEVQDHLITTKSGKAVAIWNDPFPGRYTITATDKVDTTGQITYTVG